MTKLNKNSFIILTIAYSAFILASIISGIILLTSLDVLVATQMEALQGLDLGNLLGSFEQFMRTIFILTAVFSMLWGTIYHAIMLLYMFSHRKKARHGRYLTVMLVFNILGIIANFFAMLPIGGFIVSDFVFSLIGFLLCATSITGIIIHRKNPEPAPQENLPFI